MRTGQTERPCADSRAEPQDTLGVLDSPGLPPRLTARCFFKQQPVGHAGRNEGNEWREASAPS